MKKKYLPVVIAITLAGTISLQSCIGSFSLTNKVLTWNKQVNNKFVNELVFFAFWILPVYEVTAAADLLVINSIEFWSGNNPLEANNRIIDTEQGQYFIATTEQGYEIVSPNGDKLSFIFDKDDNSWSFSNEKVENLTFLKFGEDNNVQMIGPDGTFVDVELSEEGVATYSTLIQQPYMALL